MLLIKFINLLYLIFRSKINHYPLIARRQYLKSKKIPVLQDSSPAFKYPLLDTITELWEAWYNRGECNRANCDSRMGCASSHDLHLVSSIYSESDPATMKWQRCNFESRGGKRFCFARSGLQTPGIDRSIKITRLEKKVWRKILIFRNFR